MHKEVWDEYWAKLTDVPLYSLRVNLIFRNLNLQGLRTLEVGCGSGVDSLQLALNGANIIALDYSISALCLAKEMFKKYNVAGNFVMGDGFNLCFRDSSFDVVHSAGVIEHFKDPSSVIEEMVRVSKKYIMISVPQKYHIYTVKKHRKIREGTWEVGWETEYSYRELKNLLETFGLRVVDYTGSAPGCKIPLIGDFLRKYIGKYLGLDLVMLCEKVKT